MQWHCRARKAELEWPERQSREAWWALLPSLAGPPPEGWQGMGPPPERGWAGHFSAGPPPEGWLGMRPPYRGWAGHFSARGCCVGPLLPAGCFTRGPRSRLRAAGVVVGLGSTTTVLLGSTAGLAVGRGRTAIFAWWMGSDGGSALRWAGLGGEPECERSYTCGAKRGARKKESHRRPIIHALGFRPRCLAHGLGRGSRCSCLGPPASPRPAAVQLYT